MEQKRTLWIMAAVGVFLLVVFFSLANVKFFVKYL